MSPPADELLPWKDIPGLPSHCLPQRAARLTPASLTWAEALADPVAARSKRPSAVLMLFIPPASPAAPARLLFMRRSTTVSSHKGQIGLAGGRAEKTDATPAATALRELGEELGIQPDRVRVLGLLPPLPALDGQCVWPVIGAAPIELADIAPEPAEVDSVFADPWPLFGAGKGQSFRFNLFGNWRTSQLFMAPGGTVWGLTAKILSGAALA